MSDTILYAVYDSVSCQKKTGDMDEASAHTECARLGGPILGYVVCPVIDPQEPRKAYMVERYVEAPKPFEPVKTHEPSLFD